MPWYIWLRLIVLTIGLFGHSHTRASADDVPKHTHSDDDITGPNGSGYIQW